MMTGAEYIARTIHFYSQNNARMGKMNFEKNFKRFIIRDVFNDKNVTTPEDGIHCGDIYILRDIDGRWKIAQCELVDDVWKFVGTGITANNCKDIPIVYVNNRRIMRYRDCWINEDVNLGSLSYDFISELID